MGGAIVADWLFATRVGDNFSDFDYRYWPLSRTRRIGLAALVSAGAHVWMMAGSNAPVWALLPMFVLFVGYLTTVLVDVSAQRRRGYKKPPNPRYSDSGYGS